MHVMGMRLETERLIIRTFDARDQDAWLAMVNAPGFDRFLPPSPPATPETFQNSLGARHAMERERGHAMWAIDSKASGAFLGQCGLYLAERKGPEIEIAYHFMETSWNQGYATEAARAVLGYGLGPLALDSIIALVMPANVASCRVVEKVGMRFQALATYYGIDGLHKYVAERAWWGRPATAI